jgi:hypothetical protein
MNWLRWCGFRFIRLEERYGVEQRPFWNFERTRMRSYRDEIFDALDSESNARCTTSSLVHIPSS